MLGRFEILRPRSVGEACAALREHAGRATVLAGGTDLFVDIRNGVRSPDVLVDVKRIEGLDAFDVDRARGGVKLGAAVPLNAVVENRPLRDALPGLAQAAESIATYQLRNRATVVGNLCNASPAADMAPILLVLEATLTVRSATGTRTLPLAELFTGVKRTALKVDELVVDLRVPAVDGELRTGFRKQQRIRGHDLAVVNVAGALAPYRGILRLAVGSCAPTPTLLEPIETAGVSLDALVTEAVRAATTAISPIDDVRASAVYRRAVLPVLVRRLLADLIGGRDGI